MLSTNRFEALANAARNRAQAESTGYGAIRAISTDFSVEAVALNVEFVDPFGAGELLQAAGVDPAAVKVWTEQRPAEMTRYYLRAESVPDMIR